jgi:hypothetical protein
MNAQELKVGDKVRHLRVSAGKGSSSHPSKHVGEVIKIKGEMVWVRFTSEAGVFDRHFAKGRILKEGEQ